MDQSNTQPNQQQPTSATVPDSLFSAHNLGVISVILSFGTIFIWPVVAIVVLGLQTPSTYLLSSGVFYLGALAMLIVPLAALMLGIISLIRKQRIAISLVGILLGVIMTSVGLYIAHGALTQTL